LRSDKSYYILAEDSLFTSNKNKKFFNYSLNIHYKYEGLWNIIANHSFYISSYNW